MSTTDADRAALADEIGAASAYLYDLLRAFSRNRGCGCTRREPCGQHDAVADAEPSVQDLSLVFCPAHAECEEAPRGDPDGPLNEHGDIRDRVALADRATLWRSRALDLGWEGDDADD